MTRVRGWLVDIALAGAAAAAAWIGIASSPEVASRAPDLLAYALGAAMAAPVLLRRRWPLAALYLVAVVLLVYYALDYPGFLPTLVLAVPLYDSARTGRVWPAVPVPAAFLSMGYLVAVRGDQSPLAALTLVLPQAALAAVALLAGALVRSRLAYTEEMRQRLALAERQRHQEAERRVAEERLRIARELHDTVAHAITTITVQSGSALHLLDREPGRAREALAAIRQTGKAALGDIRATLHVLRSDDEPAAVTDGSAGLHRLPGLLAAVRAAGVEVSCEGDVAAGELAPPVDHAAYRIVQEALTNVLRHAGAAARAWLTLAWEPGWLTIEVRDDGPGTGGTSGGGHGLTGMRERAAAVDGECEAGPLPAGGFRVRARLPLRAGSEGEL
ncbi:MAG: sensor histidine kinase [Micromonosporaceae bacterium]